MDYPVSDPSANLHAGKFSDGDPALGILPSTDKARDMNAAYDELLNLIRDGGLEPDETRFDQVKSAIHNLIAAAVALKANTTGTYLSMNVGKAALVGNTFVGNADGPVVLPAGGTWSGIWVGGIQAGSLPHAAFTLAGGSIVGFGTLQAVWVFAVKVA